MIKVGTKINWFGVLKVVTEIQADIFHPARNVALFDDGTKMAVTDINENDIVLPTEFDLRYTHDVPEYVHSFQFTEGGIAHWIYHKLYRGCVLDEANLNHVYIDGMIAKKDLVDGAIYLGHCRNSQYAVWDAGERKFKYVREKFGNEYWDEVEHPEDDIGYDVFVPTLKLDVTEWNELTNLLG